MRLLIINSVCGISSTGRICEEIAREYEKKGYEVKIAYGRNQPTDSSSKWSYRIGGVFNTFFHLISTRISDNHGLVSNIATKCFLKWAEEFSPDICWIHNLHGYYINYHLLFMWIKSHPEMDVRWTLHDCWAFTGHCAYFSYNNCNQWKTGCKDCKHSGDYPKSCFISNSQKNFMMKKEAFLNVRNMRIITPSKWLEGLVKQSFLKDYPVEVKYNSINKSIFRPRESSFRIRNGLTDKKVLLSVAAQWSKRKGLDDLIWISDQLDESFALVIVGLSNKQYLKVKDLKGYDTFATTEANYLISETEGGYVIPKNKRVMLNAVLDFFDYEIIKDSGNASVIPIDNISDPNELAEIYSASDLFLNTTYEDNYPTVNLEARACGLKVITYDTGGCKETLESLF